MNAGEVPDSERLRDALKDIPSDGIGYGAWWGSDDGKWLHAMINDRIGVPVARQVRRQYDASYDPADVANNAVATLAHNFVRAAIQKADDPWAYLYTTLKRELSGQAGRYFRTSLNTDYPLAEPEQDTQSHTSVSEAILLTIGCLRDFTPSELIPGMIEAVFFFAEHGHTRLSYIFTVSSKDSELVEMGLESAQIRAIGNIVLGSRPNHKETSILAGFLLDDSWDPRTSPAHRRALDKYEGRMNRASILNPEKVS